ncbi:MAG: YdcF family protein [Sulfurospirillaceae bacterium]|nr:YdcF family protein [Sulfurospirillaceae bacterium]
MTPIYILSKVFTYSVLPPSIFIIALFLASLFAKKFRLFFFTCSALFYALSNTYVADALLSPLEKPYNVPLQETRVDALIVLSGGSTKGASNLPLGDEAYKRTMWGLMIAKSHNVPLLFSGAGVNQDYSESDAFLDTIKELKTHLGIEIPIDKTLKQREFSLHVESKSIDTYENAKLSKMAFEREGITQPTIYLVTSAYHMRRSIKLYEHFGFKVIPAATSFQMSTRAKDAWNYLPSIGALNKSYTALHEYAGLLSLKLRGI